ncbi:MAG: IreB family regulatory phosphoprotein [Clostridia bacterium]|nr:IreB family regulatory phosphoprotein [Clostridia bacterium]
MKDNLNQTKHFKPVSETPSSAAEIIDVVYQALKAKGHDPIMQLVGYIISGDPTYITSHNNARALIRRLERDELLEEFVRAYVENLDKRSK